VALAAIAFFAADFFAAFLAGGLVLAAFFAAGLATVLVAAFFVADFFAETFVAAIFTAGAFLAETFLAGAFFAAAGRVTAFFAGALAAGTAVRLPADFRAGGALTCDFPAVLGRDFLADEAVAVRRARLFAAATARRTAPPVLLTRTAIVWPSRLGEDPGPTNGPAATKVTSVCGRIGRRRATDKPARRTDLRLCACYDPHQPLCDPGRLPHGCLRGPAVAADAPATGGLAPPPD
jgi:hypothetical protein